MNVETMTIFDNRQKSDHGIENALLVNSMVRILATILQCNVLSELPVECRSVKYRYI